MQAAILNQAGSLLEVKEVPAPKLHAASVRVRVLSTHILSFTNLVVGGQFPFPLPTPYIPGLSAIGIVEEIADDVTGIQVGQKVFCSPLIASRNNSASPERILKGWFGLTPNCENLLNQWKDGAFAQNAVYPVECVTPIDFIGENDPAQLACMYYLCIAYGAFLRGEFKTGQSVVINGATGNLGTASVLVALAMGASKIYAVGRNISVLHELEALDPKRITTVSLPDQIEDYSSLFSIQVGEADLLVDAVGVIDNSALVEAGLSVLRPHGTAVFLGGVITNVPVSYLTALVKELNIKGSSMYPDSAPRDIAKMIEAGLLNLKAFEPKAYSLNQINDAIAAASKSRGLEYVVLKP
ncbi:zinc-binding dehydrogenase [Paenibacillus hamazuiensis]|uniref:zinc-binding dehydrogenase n=1 Tax=Paenibacillus hamazuiensis TaxID=2936508 RepID=UPI0020102C7E